MLDSKVGEYPPSRMVSHYGTWSILVRCSSRVLVIPVLAGCGCGDDDFSGCLALANSFHLCM